MKRYASHLGGHATSGTEVVPVMDKYLREPFAEVALADEHDVERAVGAAHQSFVEHRLSPWERYEILAHAAELVRSRHDALVETMVAETGFTRSDAATDVTRCVQTLLISAEEAKRLQGELVPLAGAPAQDHRMGFTIRVPLGVVCAITPFNSPLNTVAHKIAPALAAGNTVVLKPSLLTPLSSAHLADILFEAGLPRGHLCVLFGSGSTTGAQLVADPRIRFYTFTGSTAVGRSIQAGSGLRRTQMELGSIATTIVCADADLELACKRTVAAAFRKAGQVCTSVQKLFVHASVFPSVLDELLRLARPLRVGDPRQEGTDIGPMISPEEAERVSAWVAAAVDGGATNHLPSGREGALQWPALLTEVDDDMSVACHEVFGPVLSLFPFDDLADAVQKVNASPYGLSAGIFTQDIDAAFETAYGIESGVVQVNETSSSRVDLMPFGGTKESGFGREGPHYAMREMSEERLIVLNLRRGA